MFGHLETAAIVTAVALAAAWTSRARLVRAVLWAGAASVVGAWVPLLVAVWLDPEGAYIGNALGFGMLAWFGGTAGLIIVAIGFVMRLAEFIRSRSRI